MKAMQPPSAARPPQRGLALIVAMLVAALAAAVAVSVATAQSQWLAQVEHRRDQVEAQSIATAGIAWARAIVEADAPGVDHLGEPWALPLPPTPVENGDVQGRIVDAQSMLNVNTLGSGQHASAAQQRFARLFAALAIPAPALASITDWLDADDAAGNGGAEDAWYMAQDEPSLAANGAAARFEELSAIRGMTPQTMARLAPFVTALPGDAPVNVNTAPPEVLAAAIAGLDAAGVARLVALRREQPFVNISDLRGRLPAGATLDNEAAFSTGSDYFLVTVVARQGASLAQARALLKRGTGSWPQVVWQTLE